MVNFDAKFMPGGGVRGMVYHDLPFEGYEIKANRPKIQDRVNQIANSEYDIKGKRGLDLGCSIGGISFGLQMLGASMVGIDYDNAAIKIAQGVEKIEHTGAVFFRSEVTRKWLSRYSGWDFTVWLSNYMWVAKKEGRTEADKLLSFLSEAAPVCFFETSQGEGKAQTSWIKNKRDVKNLLYKSFDHVGELGDSVGRKRTVFMAVHYGCKMSRHDIEFGEPAIGRTYPLKRLADKEVEMSNRFPSITPKVLKSQGELVVTEKGVPLNVWSNGRGVSEKREMFHKLIKVVETVQLQGVIHRDIHAKNVVVVNGEPKLIDWSLSETCCNGSDYDLNGRDKDLVPEVHKRRRTKPMCLTGNHKYSIQNILGWVVK